MTALPTFTADNELPAADLQQAFADVAEVAREMLYAASSAGNDTYAITPYPAISAYAVGQVFYFKADVANTGAATLNVNGKGAIAIKKNKDVALTSNDIKADSLVAVIFDGTNFQMINQLANPSIDLQVFTGNGTWTKPVGVNAGSRVIVELWGGGGGGGSSNANAGSGGGGGGAYHRFEILASLLGATETITVGALGAKGAADSDGSAGGASSFGTWAYAYGGGGGGKSTAGGGGSGYGGGGGGIFSAGGNGSSGAGGAGGAPLGGASPDGVSIYGGAGSCVSGGGVSVFGGSGGARQNASIPTVMFGGAGGGGVSAPGVAGNGGISLHGGNGGNGANGNGTDGSAPGGGGGGGGGVGAGVGGDGARGEVRVTTIL